MKIIRDDLWLCDDCLLYAVKGDVSGIDDRNRERDVIEGVNALGPHLVPDFDSEAPEDEDEDNGIREFSYTPCDACGTRLGGGRHRFAVLGEEKKRKGGRPSPSNMRIGSRRNPLPSFLSGYSGGELALIAGGVGLLGYIAYRIWDANYSSAAQGAQAWADSQSGTSSSSGVAGLGQQSVQTDETPNFCISNPGNGYCWDDQENSTYPSVGDSVAVMSLPIPSPKIPGSTTGTDIPIWATVYSVDESAGTVTIYFADPNVLHTFPVSYIVTGLDLVGAAAGF